MPDSLYDLFWSGLRKPRIVETPSRSSDPPDDVISVEGMVDDSHKPPLTDREKDERNLVAEFQILAVGLVIDAEYAAIQREFE